MEKRSEQHSKELLNLHNYLARETRGSRGRESGNGARCLTRQGSRTAEGNGTLPSKVEASGQESFGVISFSFLTE